MNWGDGSNEESFTSNSLAHTYSSSGTYKVKINSNSGNYQPRFSNFTDEDSNYSVAIGGSDILILNSIMSKY